MKTLQRFGSFRAQLAIMCAASVSICAMAGVVVWDTFTRSRQALLDDAQQQCLSAANELGRQIRDRSLYGGDAVMQLPVAAQDVSLRGITETVLRGYESMEGGFYTPEAGVVGYGSPHATGTVKAKPAPDELTRILDTVRQAARSVEPAIHRGDLGPDLVVIAAACGASGQPVAWVMKRVPGLRNLGGAEQRTWLLVLAAFGLCSVAAVFSIWYWLRRGVGYIRDGLLLAGSDLSYRLQPAEGEFGEIARSINEMAARRADLEIELRQQDRLAALGRVVSGVAHEIRNPLNSMRLTLDLLNRRIHRGIPASDEIEDAIRQVDRLNLILSRLLSFGREPIQDRRMQPLGPIIARAVAMVAEHSRQKSVAVRVAPTDVSANVDGPQIEQVMINLLLNAIDASPAEGCVSVAVRENNAHVSVSVCDKGAGIPADVRAHVFDAYYTTRADGTGLGLSVSREITAKHGGDLRFDTSESGTSFVLELPREGMLREA